MAGRIYGFYGLAIVVAFGCGARQDGLKTAIATENEKGMLAYCHDPRDPQTSDEACAGLSDYHAGLVDEGVNAGDFQRLAEFCRDTYSATTVKANTRQRACEALVDHVGADLDSLSCDEITPELGIDLRRLVAMSGYPDEHVSVRQITANLAQRAGECERYSLIFDFYPTLGFTTNEIYADSISVADLDTILLSKLSNERSQRVYERFLWRLDRGPIACDLYRPLSQSEPTTTIAFARACPDEARSIALEILRASHDSAQRRGACSLMADAGKPWDARFVERISRQDDDDNVKDACAQAASFLYSRQSGKSALAKQ